MCAGRVSQRSQAIWLTYHWKWILRAWIQAEGVKPRRGRSPSQPTISRLLAGYDSRYLSDLMTAAGRDNFYEHWIDCVNKAKAKQKARKEAARKRGSRIKRRRFEPAVKPRPQYCLDGKARSGCLSQVTGRTDMDLTLYSPETAQVLGHVTLPDKIGEPTAAFGVIFTAAGNLPPGIFTCDAGITCPDVIKMVRQRGHGYLLGIKGNAGKVHDVIADFAWDNIDAFDMFFNEGHGRQEIRTIKVVPIEKFNSQEFDKYEDIAVVYCVKADIRHVKEDVFTTEKRYFIGDRTAASLTTHQALTFIRDHWQQESFHWVKDVVLGEDACPTKNQKGSRTLGLLRNVVVKVGRSLFGSVKVFVDHFSSNPERTYDS